MSPTLRKPTASSRPATYDKQYDLAETNAQTQHDQPALANAPSITCSSFKVKENGTPRSYVESNLEPSSRCSHDTPQYANHDHNRSKRGEKSKRSRQQPTHIARVVQRDSLPRLGVVLAIACNLNFDFYFLQRRQVSGKSRK